jgi:hypothetical protein
MQTRQTRDFDGEMCSEQISSRCITPKIHPAAACSRGAEAALLGRTVAPDGAKEGASEEGRRGQSPSAAARR